MDEQKYDKKRIVSTVILFIFLAVGLFFAITFLPIGWKMINEAVESAKNSNQDSSATAQVIGGGAIALVAAIGIVLVFMVFIGILIVSPICLIFSIKNRKSTLKPVRIISYVQDGLFSSLIVISIVKIILLLCGI